MCPRRARWPCGDGHGHVHARRCFCPAACVRARIAAEDVAARAAGFTCDVADYGPKPHGDGGLGHEVRCVVPDLVCDRSLERPSTKMTASPAGNGVVDPVFEVGEFRGHGQRVGLGHGGRDCRIMPSGSREHRARLWGVRSTRVALRSQVRRWPMKRNRYQTQFLHRFNPTFGHWTDRRRRRSLTGCLVGVRPWHNASRYGRRPCRAG